MGRLNLALHLLYQVGMRPNTKLLGFGTLTVVLSFFIGYTLNSHRSRPFFYEMTSAEYIQHYDSVFTDIYGADYDVDLSNQGALLCLEGFPQFCFQEATDILLNYKARLGKTGEANDRIRAKMLALDFYFRGCELADLNSCLQVIVHGSDVGLDHKNRLTFKKVSNWCEDGWQSACDTIPVMLNYKSKIRMAKRKSIERKPASF